MVSIVLAMLVGQIHAQDTINNGLPPPPPISSERRNNIWQKNSFQAPFDSFDDHSGDRNVNQYWTAGGDTSVNHNYIRLTNDRQNKRGWLYNKEPLKARDFSIQIKFRVSGQGQHLYGDGFVLWVTQNQPHEWNKSGEFFAGPRAFTGFAVAFDTYKNAEMGSTHKDIYLLTNDGSSELDIHSPLAGCTANYRWFEKREDFSVRDYAIARVSYNSGTNKLRVEIDGANTHRFVECFDTELPHGQFIAGAHIAFSATTGQLADNHDILAVDTASYGTEITSDDEEQHYFLRDIALLEKNLREMPGGAETITLMKLWRQEQDKRLNHLHHQFEHELEFLRDSLQHTINKIKSAEQDDAQRITKLEQMAAKAAKRNVETQIRDVKYELQADRKKDVQRAREHHDQKLQESESKMMKAMHRKLEEVSVGGDDSFWKISSIILLIMILVVLVIAYRKYKQIYEHGHLP